MIHNNNNRLPLMLLIISSILISTSISVSVPVSTDSIDGSIGTLISIITPRRSSILVTDAVGVPKTTELEIALNLDRDVINSIMEEGGDNKCGEEGDGDGDGDRLFVVVSSSDTSPPPLLPLLFPLFLNHPLPNLRIGSNAKVITLSIPLLP